MYAIEPIPLSAQYLSPTANGKHGQGNIARGGVNIVTKGENRMDYYRK